MKLSSDTHDELQRFFRKHYHDTGLRLPPIRIHAGFLAKLLMKAAGMGAITFGRHVFVRPTLIKKDKDGRATMPGWLLAHEVAHILQYEDKGWIRFFRDYLSSYFRALRFGGSWGAQSRMIAYMAIAEERAAREVENAFRELKQAKIEE